MKYYVRSDFGLDGEDRGYSKERTRDWAISPNKLLKRIFNYEYNVNNNPDSQDIDVLEDDLARFVRYSIEEATQLKDRLDSYLRALYAFQHSQHTASDIDRLKDDILNSNI